MNRTRSLIILLVFFLLFPPWALAHPYLVDQSDLNTRVTGNDPPDGLIIIGYDQSREEAPGMADGQKSPTIPPIEDRIRMEPELMSGNMVITWKKNLQIGFPILELRSAGSFHKAGGKTDLWYFTLQQVRPVQYIVLPEPKVWRTKPNGKWQGSVRKIYKACQNYDFVNLRCKK